MENKNIGVFIGFLIVVAVCVAMLPAIAQSQASITDTVTLENVSLGAVVVNGTAQYLTGYKSITDVEIYNETGDLLLLEDNYTITNNVIVDGAEVISILPDTEDATLSIWQVSGTAEPDTYGNSSGTRAIAGLIVLMSALALLGYAIYNFGKGSGYF